MLRLEVQILSSALVNKDFYKSEEYIKKQSILTRLNWKKGVFDFHRKREKRICKNKECRNIFETKPSNPKIFCSQNCSASYNNNLRGPHTLEWRRKISESLKKSPYHYSIKGKILVPRLIKNCLTCGKKFETPRWQNHKYCNVMCSIKDIGSRRTSPKAAKGKNGIRLDISPDINFYSRWEANFARILNLLNIKWQFQPRTFDLGSQKYTPDFYLPEYNIFIEIKNFLSDFSIERDQKFRKFYPDIKLLLITKEEYLDLQSNFAPLIKNWEFS